MKALEALSQKAAAPKPSVLILAASSYLGLAYTLRTWFNIETGFISTAFFVALALALVGWRRLSQLVPLRSYLPWAVIFVVWFGLSSVAAWDTEPFVFTLGVAIWLLFIVPGLTGLWTDETIRRAFLVGAAIGVTVYGVVALIRTLSGDPVRDVNVEGEPGRTLLGMIRNDLNVRAVFVMPFLLGWAPRVRQAPLRWVALGFLALWIVMSGGRSGILAALVVVILYVILQPDAGRRVQVGGLILLLSVTTFFAMTAAGGPAGDSANRFVAAVQGERTSTDDIRDLAARKAWQTGMENPGFGIGPRSLTEYYHPVIDEGRSPRVQRQATLVDAHNTYVEVMAIAGIPGALAFVLLLGSVFAIGVRRSRHTDVRLATAALGGVMTAIYFNTSISSSLYYAFALILAASATSRGDTEGARTRSSQALPGRSGV